MENILFGASFFVVMATLLVACNEDMYVKQFEKSDVLTYEEEVAAAREFYEAKRPPKTRVTADLSTESGMIANMEPLWGKQFTYRRKNKKIRTVETGWKGASGLRSCCRKYAKNTKKPRIRATNSL